MLTAVAMPALAAFYREFYPRLYRFVFAQTGAPHADVDDIVQETLLQAWRRHEEFLGQAAPELDHGHREAQARGRVARPPAG